jgi:AraC-like DNA-binding protein
MSSSSINESDGLGGQPTPLKVSLLSYHPLFTGDYLTLKLVRLKPPEKCSTDGPGLSFVFLKRGLGEYASGQGRQKLSPGDVLALHTSVQGEIRPLNGGELAFHQFCACVEHLVSLLATREIALLQRVCDGLKNSRFYPASGALARECHELLDRAPAQFTLEHRSHLLRIAASILSMEFKNLFLGRAGGGDSTDRVTQVLEQLSPEEIANLSVHELSRKFNCGRRHLNRLFHQCFGTSVGALKMEMRLLKAVALLHDPQAKVIDIAGQCGFHHLGLFNNCFKKRFGASPGQWRKFTLRIEVSPADSADGSPSCQMRKNGLCPWVDHSHPARPVLPPKPNARLLSRLSVKQP